MDGIQSFHCTECDTTFGVKLDEDYSEAEVRFCPCCRQESLVTLDEEDEDLPLDFLDEDNWD